VRDGPNQYAQSHGAPRAMVFSSFSAAISRRYIAAAMSKSFAAAGRSL
jgi:hypothetical protein